MTYPDVSLWKDELITAIDAVQAASDVIMEFYTAQSADTYTKGDGSPVTDADLASDRLLRERISSRFPDDDFLTEESERTSTGGTDSRVWIIDPIDGTKEFIAKSGKFDVLCALVVGERPVVAVSIQPATGLMHAAVADHGAFRNETGTWERFVTDEPSSPPRLVRSIWYQGEDADSEIGQVAQELGSAPPDLLRVGYQPRAFDRTQRFYDAFIGFPHRPGTSFANEWDLCASDLITNEAGGRFTDIWGRFYPYNKRNTHISGGVLVSASPELHARLVDAIASVYPHEPAALDPADDLNEG